MIIDKLTHEEKHLFFAIINNFSEEIPIVNDDNVKYLHYNYADKLLQQSKKKIKEKYHAMIDSMLEKLTINIY